MDSTQLLQFAAWGIYGAMAAAALYGTFTVILLTKKIAEKRFRSETVAGEFLEEVRHNLQSRNFDGVVELCDSPPYWSKATPQLILVGLENKDLPTLKLRRLLGEKFERDILADVEYRTSWVATIVKSAPMLGLLGTVVGMINAFGKIAGASSGIDPKDLADDISFALVTTALGLTIAIPLVLAGNMLHVRIGKMQDAVQEDVGEFLEDLNKATASTGGS